MCYVHLTDPSARERMLSGDEWIDLMEQAIERGMMIALLTGGECLTYPDFKKIYKYLIEQGISVRLKSNGILLNSDMTDLFTEYPPYMLDVSLYGCDNESYRAVTGHDVFETVTANIRASIEAGLHVRLMVPPSVYTLPWADRIMEYAKTFGADEVIVNAMLTEANPDTGRKMESFGLSLEENARIFRKRLELFPWEPKTQIEEEAELMGEIPEDEPHILPKGLYCNGGRTTFTINWDGTMGPCINFPRNVICADVKKNDFEKAWQEINQGVKDYDVPEACHACSYNTKCHYCPGQHMGVASRHLFDSAVCDWRKLQADISEEYRAKRRAR